MAELLNQLSETAAFIIYQHLQRNSKKHQSDITNKIETLLSMHTNIKASVYQEKDLALLFLTKSKNIHDQLKKVLVKYYKRSTIIKRSLF